MAGAGHNSVICRRCLMGKTSPANSTSRRAGNSSRVSPPNSARRLRTEGVEYQTLTRRSAIKRANSRGFLPSSSGIRHSFAPCFKET